MNEKLGDQHLHVGFVPIGDLKPLSVHLADVVVVALTQLVHPADQVVALVGQVGQLVVHRCFHVPVFDLLGPQVVKLLVQVSDAALGVVVVIFQLAKIVSLPD